jgi:hypothetical protein
MSNRNEVGIAFLMDVHIPSAVTDECRLRNVDVLTAQEDGARQLSDSDLLDRATALGRILVTQDTDFLAEASARVRAGRSFMGVIYAPQTKVRIGTFIDDLELIAKVDDPSYWANRVVYLPL